jgi:hypothetical protein
MDVGAVMRGLEDKVAAIRRECAGREHADRWRVRGLLIVRATRRNRVLIGELAQLLAARYPARSAAWLAAVGHANTPMPDDDGFLWTAVASPDLRAARLSRARAPS